MGGRFVSEYALEDKGAKELPNEAFHRIGEERRSPPGELVVRHGK